MEAVTLSWQLVQGLNTTAHDFWPALKGFVSMAFHGKLLELTDISAPTLLATLKQVNKVRLVNFERKENDDFLSHVTYMWCDCFQIAAELIELSQSKSGVLGVLLQHCCQTWLPTDRGSGDMADTVFASVFSHINILTEACVYGPVFRRDQR